MRVPLSMLVAISIACALPGSVWAKDIYVSVRGDDTNSGAKDTPLATLTKAIDAMHGEESGTIWIDEGEYFLEQGVVFGSEHSGTAEQPLVIRGVAPGKTRLTGARVVKDLRPLLAEEVDPLISPEAKRRVLVADLSTQGFAPLRAMPDRHRAHGREEVIFGDQPMQSARWPNEGFAVFTEVVDAGASAPTHWVTREVYRPGSFRFPGDRAKQWDFARGVWLHGFWCYDWSDDALKAESYDAETGELRLAAKHAYGIGNPWNKESKRRFYALHVFEELDTPGEYYLDRKHNRLFFWPPGDVADTPVRLTQCTEPLIRADGVSHLVLRDLTIENTCGSGIELLNCRHCVVENCLLRNTGGAGGRFVGSQLSVVRCEVTGTASYGLSISGGDRKTLTPGKCSVLNCHVHHVGRLDWQGGRGISVHGCGNRMANNLMHHAPTGAVSYSGNEHTLELNEVHNVCLHYSDVGVFYTGRDWSSRGNLVRWNYIHHNTNNTGHGSSAIYLDDCDSGDRVVGNIVLGGVGRGVLLGGGRDNAIDGNVFVGLPIGIHVDARGPRGITLDKPGSWNLLAKCEQVDYLSPLWKARYPRLATTMDNNPLMPLGNSMHHNLLIGCDKPFSLSKDVDERWLDRAGNMPYELSDIPALEGWEASQEVDLAELRTWWEQLPEFPSIPIEKIGLRASVAP